MRVLALIAGLWVLSACATGGTYHPNTAGASDGYSETRLDETHWAVEFIGDPSASQETVESYLLYRAAELTVLKGYDWFMPANQTLETESEVVVTGARRSESPVWRPMWRHRSRTRWTDWMVRGASPAESPSPAIHAVDRLAAREEIALGRGPAPEGAFDAREVMAVLEPSIVRP